MRKNPVCLAIGMLVSSLGMTIVYAQSPAPPRQSLEEVVVTAQRRTQSLMDVPLSIQALSGDRLRSTGIDDLTSIQFTSPGYLPDTNNGFVQIFIRGIGNAIFLGADPSVATFVDDVPQIYGATSDSLVDIERVEILKGAQGGLYGRNATAGVINIITRKPNLDETTGELVLSYGERDTVRAAGYLSVPLTETAAWSISAQRDTHDAYVSNKAPSQPYSAANFPNGSFIGSPGQTAAFFNAPQSPGEIFDQDFWAVRSKLLIEPVDSFSFTLAAHASDKRDSASGQFVSSTPEFNQAALVGLFNTLGIEAALPPGFIQGATGKWASSIGVQNHSYIREHGVSGTAIWSAAQFELTSITAYRSMETETVGDNGTSTVPFIPFTVDFDRENIYQEFRLSAQPEGPFRFLAGATYLRNEIDGESEFFLLSYTIPVGNTSVSQKIDNWSVYGEAGYDLTDRLNLTVSGRYMREKNDAKFTQPVVSATDSVQSKFIPSATLSYDIEGGTAYARWARGFKTGGVNILTAPAFYPRPSDGSIFGPETVDTYEIGFKKAFAANRVQLNAAAFYNDYRDLQVDVRPRPRPEFAMITTAIVNADSAETWGAEVGIDWLVAEPLTVGLNAGYLKAEYQDFALSGSTVLSDFDLSGERMPKSPEWQLSFTANYDQPISSRWRFVSNLLVAHTSKTILKYSAYPGVLPNAEGTSYWMVNARAGLQTHDDRYSLFLVADNLFDEEYFIGADAGTFGNLLNYGQRRIVRAELTYRF